MADAEDAVHDTFVKWFSIDTSKIQNAKAYLIRMLTNICLNVLQSRKNKDSVSLDEMSDSIADHDSHTSLVSFDIENQLDEALKYIYRKLEPIEQGIFVLREAFDVEYEDLQVIFDKKAENCRKILSRAKSKLKNTDLKQFSGSITPNHILDNIKNASRKGYLAQLINHFKSENF